MTMIRRTALRAMLGALSALLIVGSTVLAESGFSDPVTLRTGPAGAGVELEDVAAKGSNVSVVWEEFEGGQSDIRLRTSMDGGRTFRSQRLVEDRHGSNASTDICAGFAWVAHSFRLAGDPNTSDGLIVDGLAMSGPVVSGEALVSSGGSQNVDETDFACVGSRRRAAAWVDRDFKATSIVHVRFLPILLDPNGQEPPDFERSFEADGFTPVALAASGSHAWLAWHTTDRRIRIKPFDVGPGPDFTVTPRPAVTLPDSGSSSGGIGLGAAGSRVVIAYGLNGHTFARVSTDWGASFGPRERLLTGFEDGLTSAVSADIRGSRAVVHAVETGGFIDPAIRAHRFQSTNDGASWNGVLRDSDGIRMGAFTADGGTRLVEAWDQSASNNDPQRLRFHREL